MSSLEETHTDEPSPDYPEAWVLALLSAVVFVAVVNGTMVNVALPFIGEDFAVTEGVYGWLVTGYSLAFGVFNAVDGRLADIVGVKRLYLSGILILGITSIILAWSPTIGWAIGLRVLQGAGSAALPVLGATIIAHIVPPARRGQAMGVILSTVGVAASLGPFLGGGILQVATWRWVFALVGVVLLAFPLAWKLLPESLNRRRSNRFDLVGATLLGAGVAAVTYGFDRLRDGQIGADFLAIEAGGVLALLAFWAWVNHVREPFTPPEVLRDGRFMSVCAQAFASNGTRFGTLVLAPIYLKEINGMQPLLIGAVLFPGALCVAIFSRLAGRWADAHGPRGPVTLGTLVLLAGNIVTALFAGGSPWGVTAGMTLTGLGFAFIQTPLLSNASQLVPQEQTSGGLGLFMMILFIGGAFGVAAAVITVEVQPANAISWLGLDRGPGARYANATLVLAALGLVAVGLITRLPKGKFHEEHPEAEP